MWRLYALLTITMFLWGLNLPMLKYLLTFMNPVTMTALRVLTAGITVFVILSAFKLLRLPTKKEWTYIIGGAALVVMHHYFLNMGLFRTTGTNASLILGTGPVLTAICTALILRNYPTRVQWIGAAVGFIGIGSVVLAGGENLAGLKLGDAFIFFAILAQVLSFLVIAKAARTLDPRLLTAYMLVIGSLLLFVISFIQEPGELIKFTTVPPKFWTVFAASAILSTAIGHMLYNYSIAQIGPSKAAIFMNLNTLFSLIGSALFLGEIITGRHLIGFILIIIGVILGSGAAEDLWKKRKKKKELPA